MAKSAIYPGTFDPVTNGHSDLIHRAARLFDELVVGIAANPGKTPLFDLDERVVLVRVITDDIPNVRVIGFSGLLINCMRDIGTLNVVRGLRAVSDFEYEFQLAAMNRRLDPNVESVFLTPAESHTFISASLVKEIAQLGGDVSQFLHPTVHRAVMAKFRDRPAANPPA